MALAAQQGEMITGVRREATHDYPCWASRRVVLSAGAALWVALICVCTMCGPSVLLWAVVAAIWAALALACVRIQIYRRRPSEAE